MAKKPMGVIALALVFSLAGCATSSFNGYVSAGQDDARVVEAGGVSSAALAQVAIVQNPDVNGGRVSPKALRKIQQYAISCQRQVDAQLAGPIRSAIGGAVEYGLPGAVGTGAGAVSAFGSAVKFGTYATYAGIPYAFTGAVNGLVSGSYALASAKGDCTRQFWEDVVKTDPDFRGTHVLIVYAGKSGDPTPPALAPAAVVAPAPAAVVPAPAVPEVGAAKNRPPTDF